MYSKAYGRGYVPRTGEPAYRQPVRTPMQVPSNYSGHAIIDGEERPLGVMPSGERESVPARDTPTPRFDGLPRVSDLGDSARRRDRLSLPMRTGETEDLPTTSEEDLADAGEDVIGDTVEGAAASLAAGASLIPGGGRSLFGHGIGSDELLILGLILLLLREGGECEDRGDLDETVILLGLVLLLG